MKFFKKRRVLKIILLIILIGYLIPQDLIIPVDEASSADWNSETFWYYPWGRSITHKGVDIFGDEGKSILTATGGIVIAKGDYGRGGNVVLVLGPKWRLHYYAHLKEINTGFLSHVSKGEVIGTLGKTGNAANTPAHLHYSIMTPIPYPWLIDGAKQGWLKMFYLNPLEYLE